MCLLRLFGPMGELFMFSLSFLSFSCTYDSHKRSFLAFLEFTANIKGWEDVNKLSVEWEGESPLKTKGLRSSKPHVVGVLTSGKQPFLLIKAQKALRLWLCTPLTCSRGPSMDLKDVLRAWH